MELTLDQALQKGVEAHKAGKAQEADRYYTAILKANPKHPDANHNMGVLAVGVGKVVTALPFFKAALEANPKIAQYWLSYIDALVKLDRIADAKVVFDQAKNIGIKGDGFDQIQKRLDGIEKGTEVDATSKKPKQLPKEQLQPLIDLYNKCQYQETLDLASQLLKQFPNSFNLYNLIGATNQRLGRPEEASEAFTKALSIKPDYADGYNNMGNVLKEQGKLIEAIEAYQKAITLNMDYPDAYYNMGITLQDQGRLEEAIKAYKKALSLKPDYVNASNNMGNAFKDQGKLEEAIEAYNKALAIKPDYAEAYNNIGNAFKDQGKLEEAIESFNKALSIKPDYAEAYYNLGNPLKYQGKLDEAIEAYNKALSIKPDFAEAYNNIGVILEEQGKLEEAIEAYNKALAIKPDFAEAYNNIAAVLQEQGKLEEATEAYNKALAIKPDFAEAHRNLSFIKKYKENDNQINQVQELYKHEDLSEDQKCNLSFALVKMYEDIGDLDKSFAFLTKGNSLRKQLLNYSIDQDKNLFSKLKNAQPYLFKTSLDVKAGSIETIPIFILGMPRSGTTLVEQIISSHSEVLGAGELDHVSQLGLNLSVDPKAINTTAISEFRKMYLSELSTVSCGRQFVTDKMPQNFRFIPLICAAFPEAKIIHVQRNASATCWSNYKHYFVSDSLGYCYDLKDIVSYYNLYSEVMKFWKSQYFDRIYNLNYENLVSDQENQTGKLINHLELDWEEACLSPHQNKRSVRTVSQQQVRQKVYKGSSEAWRKYEPYLNGAFNNLLSS